MKVLNRRICSYKMVEVPRDAYAVTEEEQEIYLIPIFSGTTMQLQYCVRATHALLF